MLSYFEKCFFISIVIPVKNEGKFVRECLNAVTKMNYPREKYEIIVVDNDSSDNSREYINEYERIILLEKKEGSIGAIRNFGAKHASGDIIAFLDGDCVPDKNWLKVGCHYLMMDEDISCIGFAVATPSSNVSWVEKTWYKMSSGSKYKGTCNVSWLSSFNLIIRKNAFLKVGGFDESLETCEDADLGFKLSKISKLIFSDKITIEHLGTVKTVTKLFLKELWRGKGNLKSFLQNDNKMENITSVFIPVIYLSLVLLLCVLLFLYVVGIGDITIINLTGMIVIFVPILLAIIKQKTYQLVEISRVAFLYFIYLCARGLAIFKIRLEESK